MDTQNCNITNLINIQLDHQILEFFCELCNQGDILALQEFFDTVSAIKKINFSENDIDFPRTTNHSLIINGFRNVLNNKLYNIIELILNNLPSLFLPFQDIFDISCNDNNTSLLNIIINCITKLKPKFVFDDTRINNAFHIAAKDSKIEIMKILYLYNRNININFYDILLHACKKGFIDVFQYLLEINPDFNLSTKRETLFITACTYGHLNIVEFLLNRKPSIEIFILNNGALKSACKNNSLNILQFIFRTYSDSLKKNIEFQDLLDMYSSAIENTNIDIFKCIIQYNSNRISKQPSNIRIKNKEKIDLIEYFKKQYPDLKDILI